MIVSLLIFTVYLSKDKPNQSGILTCKIGKSKVKNKAQASKNVAGEVILLDIYTIKAWRDNVKIMPFMLTLLAQYSSMRSVVKNSICIIVCTDVVKENGT